MARYTLASAGIASPLQGCDTVTLACHASADKHKRNNGGEHKRICEEH